MFPHGVCPLNLFAPSSDIILLCLPYVHDTSTWLWRVDLMMTKADIALGDIVFFPRATCSLAAVPSTDPSYSRAARLSRTARVSALEDLILQKA
jgi:hypothetical protein